MTAADYVAFAAMTIVFVAVVYGVILVGDLPAKVARERKHPQVAAVTALSWFGLLFTGGILWIAAIVWAYFDYSKAGGETSMAALEAEVADLRAQLEAVTAEGRESGGAA